MMMPDCQTKITSFFGQHDDTDSTSNNISNPALYCSDQLDIQELMIILLTTIILNRLFNIFK